MKENTNKKEEVFLLDLQLISSSIFIIASIVSLLITYNEKLTVTNRKKLFTNKEALNISFYNRIVILVVVVTSLYVGYKNYINEKIIQLQNIKWFTSFKHKCINSYKCNSYTFCFIFK